MRAFFSLFVLVVVGCATNDLAKMSLEEKIALGDKHYELKEYGEAIPYYDDVVFQKIGSNTQEISFRLAKCYFQREQYDLASLEYKQILSDYPRFDKLAEVYFDLAVCYQHLALSPQYDQKERYEEIATLKKFLSLYPYNDKVDIAKQMLEEAYYQLSLKKYYNGVIYYKISDFSSAMLYFKEVVDELDGQRVEALRKTLYYMCLIYIDWNEINFAKSYAADLDYYFPESYETTEMKRRLQNL